MDIHKYDNFEKSTENTNKSFSEDSSENTSENTNSSISSYKNESVKDIFKNIHVYVLYIYEEEIKKFTEQMDKNKIELDYEFYMGTNGSVFSTYFRNFLKKRKEEIKDNPIFLKIKNIINDKKYYLRNEKQLGHTRSFINIIRNAKKNKYKKICILESDVIFHKEFQNNLNKYINIINHSKLFYLGTNDSKINVTTDLITFDEEKIKKIILNKCPNFTYEQILNEINRKKNNYEKERLRFSDIIEKNNKMFKNYKIYIPFCPYGTFSMIIDESIYDLILEVLELQIYPTDVLFFYIQSVLEDEEWGVAFPNLTIADVSHSYILKNRNNKYFAISRGWELNDYYT